jgi:hypothetical protein
LQIPFRTHSPASRGPSTVAGPYALRCAKALCVTLQLSVEILKSNHMVSFGSRPCRCCWNYNFESRRGSETVAYPRGIHVCQLSRPDHQEPQDGYGQLIVQERLRSIGRSRSTGKDWRRSRAAKYSRRISEGFTGASLRRAGVTATDFDGKSRDTARAYRDKGGRHQVEGVGDSTQT